MTPAALEAYLHAQIPLTAGLGLRVRASGPAGVTLSAPLGPNINHHATVFGGSVSALAIVAAWSWLYLTLADRHVTAGIVIQRNAVEYLAPVTGDFEAHCAGAPAAVVARFLQTLQRHRRARLALEATVSQGGAGCATFQGEYVAVRT
jgi:thioesterase domain-containing protein